MITDILLVERDCPDCGVIKASIDMNATTDDDFRGKEDQELLVIASLSNRASIELLKAFGHSDKSIPLLLTHDGLSLTDINDIISRLELQGMTR